MDRNWAVIHLDPVNYPGGKSVAKSDCGLAILAGNDEIPVARLDFWHGHYPLVQPALAICLIRVINRFLEGGGSAKIPRVALLISNTHI